MWYPLLSMMKIWVDMYLRDSSHDGCDGLGIAVDTRCAYVTAAWSRNLTIFHIDNLSNTNTSTMKRVRRRTADVCKPMSMDLCYDSQCPNLMYVFEAQFIVRI